MYPTLGNLFSLLSFLETPHSHLGEVKDFFFLTLLLPHTTVILKLLNQFIKFYQVSSTFSSVMYFSGKLSFHILCQEYSNLSLFICTSRENSGLICCIF